MTILIECSCGSVVHVSEGFVDADARCPNCHKIVFSLEADMEIDIPKEQEEVPREQEEIVFEEETREGPSVDLEDDPELAGGDSGSEPERQPFHLLGSRIFWVVGSISLLVAIFICLVMLVRPWEEWEQIVEMQGKPHQRVASLMDKEQELAQAKLFAAERVVTTSPETKNEKVAVDQDGDAPAGEYREGTVSITVKVPSKESPVVPEEEGTKSQGPAENVEKNDFEEIEVVSPAVLEGETDAATAAGKQEIPEEAAIVKKNAEAIEPAAKPEAAELSPQKTESAMPIEPMPVVEKVPPVTGPRFSVNLASYKKKAPADLYVDALEKKGLNAFVWEISLPGKGTWYRVSSGRFVDLKVAQAYADRVQEKWNLETCVVKIPSAE